MPNKVEIVGGPALHSALTGLEGDLRDLSGLNGEVAEKLARAVGEAAPVDTGALAGSWEGTGTPSAAEVSSPLAYAGPQNYGVPDHNIEGTHYAEKALASSEAAAAEQYRAGLDKLTAEAER